MDSSSTGKTGNYLRVSFYDKLEANIPKDLMRYLNKLFPQKRSSSAGIAQ